MDRGTCVWCGLVQPVRADARVREHGIAEGLAVVRCPGSGYKPEEKILASRVDSGHEVPVT